jgi:hypothetical protein
MSFRNYCTGLSFLSVVMKPLIILLFSCFSLSSYSQDKYHYINPESLSWNDFKGQCDNKYNYTAITTSALRLNYKRQGDLITDVKVWVVFLYDSSCVRQEMLYKLTDIQDNYLFNHEKNHYLLNIMLAKEVKRIILNNPKMTNQDLSNLINDFNVQSSAFQIKYDTETNHSENEHSQINWNAYILNQLDGLKDIILEEPK